MGLFVFCWIVRPRKPYHLLIRTVSSASASISYSLYVFHMPFLVLVSALVIRHGPKLQPTFLAMGITLLILMAAVAYSSAM
jgi:peptidoglycan/LPS O-acetylase OafA/YrhL